MIKYLSRILIDLWSLLASVKSPHSVLREPRLRDSFNSQIISGYDRDLLFTHSLRDCKEETHQRDAIATHFLFQNTQKEGAKN